MTELLSEKNFTCVLLKNLTIYLHNIARMFTLNANAEKNLLNVATLDIDHPAMRTHYDLDPEMMYCSALL